MAPKDLLPSGCDCPARNHAASFALLTHVSADLAVFVMTRVASTLFCAQPACLRARIEQRLQDNFVTTRAPGRESAGRGTDVRTVEIQSNALCELLDLVLSETSISACGTGLGAVVACLDATDQLAVHVAADVRVCTDDFLGVHGHSLDSKLH